MQVTSCCQCLSLRTGAIIIGVLQLIGPIIMPIMSFALNIELQVSVNQADSVSGNTIYAIYFSFVIFIAILLLVGVFKRIPFMMLPWIVLSLILTVLLLIGIILLATILFVNNKVMIGVLLLVFTVIGLALYAYFWLVVYSYYLQLKSDKMSSRIGLHERPRNYQEA